MRIEKCILDNYEVSSDCLESIAKLKEQHWKYGIDSQMQWMEKNLINNDKHLMINAFENGKKVLRAYLNLVTVLVEIDSIQYEAIGVGNVCVERNLQNKGWGRVLMGEANSYIIKNGGMGVLLCKSDLLSFYEKCGWLKLQGGGGKYMYAGTHMIKK